jgi:hypothetical protein
LAANARQFISQSVYRTARNLLSNPASIWHFDIIAFNLIRLAIINFIIVESKNSFVVLSEKLPYLL